MTIVFDMDNCISDDEWRISKINLEGRTPFERYHHYHSLAGFDRLQNRWLIESYSEEEIVIITSRPELYRPIAEEWLARHDINARLIMRANDDHSPSVEFKKSVIQSFASCVKIAYDDREDIIQMYKQLGIDGRIAKIHDKEAA